ncbi:MAG: hypothetical protein L0Y64_04430, partial [Myxococcaceae bacterium]|nr:hypothetical protein [Myxococcaceae bacterium]
LQLFPVNIQSTWTSRIYALYLGLAGFSVNFDFDYARMNQVLKVGTAEDFESAPGYIRKEVPDVANGVKYAALQKVDGGGLPVGPKTPAVRMVEQSLELLDVVENPGNHLPPNATDQERAQLSAEYLLYFRDSLRDLDLMRGFVDVYGRPF